MQEAHDRKKSGVQPHSEDACRTKAGAGTGPEAAPTSNSIPFPDPLTALISRQLLLREPNSWLWISVWKNSA